MRQFFTRWQKFDWLLFFAILLLLAVSNIILYSLNLNTDTSDLLVFKKQIFFSLSCLLLFFFFSSFNYKIWQTYAKLIFILFGLILVGVLLFGVEVKGTTGWFIIGPFSIQPVEFAKLALIFMLARYFSQHANDFYMFKHIFISAVLTVLYVGLIILQPDLGSAMVLFGAWFVMLLFTGIKKSHLAFLFLSLVVVSLVAWFWLLQDYQQSRIMTFFNPGLDPQGEGYNVIQSIVAVGSGQWFGRGLALGSQSNLRFLPEPGTDFIFAVIAEELGLVGVTLLLGLFAFIFYRLFLIMRKSPDDFGAYLVLGIAAVLLVQTFVNIGMNMGISPVTGIPLPLVSAGGSSLWAVLISLGIAQNIHMRSS